MFHLNLVRTITYIAIVLAILFALYIFVNHSVNTQSGTPTASPEQPTKSVHMNTTDTAPASSTLSWTLGSLPPYVTFMYPRDWTTCSSTRSYVKVAPQCNSTTLISLEFSDFSSDGWNQWVSEWGAQTFKGMPVVVGYGAAEMIIPTKNKTGALWVDTSGLSPSTSDYFLNNIQFGRVFDE